MGNRVVQLDAAAEAKLATLQRVTGLSVAEILGRCLAAYADAVGAGVDDWEALSQPFEYYRSLDLGPGGYAYGPAEKMEELLPGIIREKHEAKKDDPH